MYRHSVGTDRINTQVTEHVWMAGECMGGEGESDAQHAAHLWLQALCAFSLHSGNIQTERIYQRADLLCTHVHLSVTELDAEEN